MSVLYLFVCHSLSMYDRFFALSFHLYFHHKCNEKCLDNRFIPTKNWSTTQLVCSQARKNIVTIRESFFWICLVHVYRVSSIFILHFSHCRSGIAQQVRLYTIPWSSQIWLGNISLAMELMKALEFYLVTDKVPRGTLRYVSIVIFRRQNAA